MLNHSPPPRSGLLTNMNGMLPWLGRIFLGVWVASVVAVAAEEPLPLQLPMAEGATHGFPELRDAQGRHLADAEFTQVPDGDRLHVTLTYDFGGGHRVVEDTIVRQRPALRQETWSWQETRAGETVRRFAVDFSTGEASAEKAEHGERKRWQKSLHLDPERTFAGFAFTLALEGLRAELTHGGQAELSAVAFTPEPRRIEVTVTYGGLEPLTMGTRKIEESGM